MPYRNEDDARRLRLAAEAITPTPAGVSWRPSSAACAALFGTTLTLIAIGAGLSTSQRIAAHAPTESPPPPSQIEAPPETDLTSGVIPRQAAALGTRDIESGTRTAHVVIDTLFHLEALSACEVATSTEAGACAISVRCGGRTIYGADEAHGLTCTRGRVSATLMFEGETSDMDGTPALVVTREEVTLVDNAASQRGMLRLTYSPLRFESN